MVRSKVAAALCLLVAASGLSVASVGTATAVGLGDCDTETATTDVVADGPVLAVVPFETTVEPGVRGVVLVCVVNPSRNDETVDFSLVVEHDHDPEEAPVFLVGPEAGRGGNSTQQVVPLDRRVRDGYGRFVTPGELPPGTGTQYALVLAADAPPGDYEFDVAVDWGPVTVEEESVLHVARSRCGWFCGVGQGIDGTVATAAAVVAYLRSHPGTLVGFATLLVTIASIVVAILSSAWLRQRLGIDRGGQR